ncbi:protein STAY-GREEN homolog, chloroplastic isoform X3 [Glycine max]|uniref:protein STAY-GREEN homolog, chloroplastic isoform X3 n=1 Tax=Glycine max TaxID=3847 RepID=UPI001B357B2E|nr:protein STAY-GREEN homolog, chloroplastic isoform X3 [Glycine max]
MATLTTAFVPSKLNPLHSGYQVSPFAHITPLRKKINQPVARLFGPAIFEVSKLEVLFLGMDQKKHPADLPRTYTLTHSDITSKITLSISQTINNSQGMPQLMDGGCDSYKNRAWTNTGLDTRQVLNAFSHGDKNLFKDYPELHDALVWVYFHSNISEFNKVECWGPLKDACAFPSGSHEVVIDGAPQSCQENCECCFIPMSSITWS